MLPTVRASSQPNAHDQRWVEGYEPIQAPRLPPPPPPAHPRAYPSYQPPPPVGQVCIDVSRKAEEMC
jgi:hypothetical protein